MNQTGLSLAKIADLLQCTPAALSNWQRRYNDFPKPIEIVGRRRLYSLSEIESFMDRHDLDRREHNYRTPEIKFVESLGETLRSRLGMSEIAGVVAALVLMKAEHSEFTASTNPKSFRAVVQTASTEMQSLLDALDSFSDSELQVLLDNLSHHREIEFTLPSQSLADAIRQIDEKYSLYTGRGHSSPSFAALVRQIAPGLRVLDLCCGLGNVMRAYSGQVEKLIGVEINPYTANFHRVLNRIEGIHGEVIEEDSLAVCHPEWMKDRFDVVIAEPPFGVKIDHSIIDTRDMRWTYKAVSHLRHTYDYWIQNVLAYLAPGATLRGLVLLRPLWFSDPAEKAMRESLIKAGVVEAVIELGRGFIPNTPIETTLLVLNKTEQIRDSIRIIDASQIGIRNNLSCTLSAVEIRLIGRAINEGYFDLRESPLKCIDVSVEDIAQNDWILTSKRYENLTTTLPTYTQVMEDVIEGEDTLNFYYEWYETSIETKLSEFFEEKIKSEFDYVPDMWTVGGLTSPDAPIESLFRIRPKDAPWSIDQVQPDDVVIGIFGSTIGAVYSGEEFLNGDNGKWQRLWILRPKSESIVPGYLLAWAKLGGISRQMQRFVTGTVAQSVSKKDLDLIEIPLPSEQIQGALASLHDQMRRRRFYARAMYDNEIEIQRSIASLVMNLFDQIEK
jgi:SAM-dependent methyltransferase